MDRPETRCVQRLTLDLACRKDLSNARAVMLIPSQSRARLVSGQGVDALASGRRAKVRFERAALVSLSLAFFSGACSDDDPAPQTGIGDTMNVPDASVRDLPGEGLEPTPEFDTDGRQREPVGPEELVETIEEIRDDLAGTPDDPGGAPDASPPVVADADAGAD